MHCEEVMLIVELFDKHQLMFNQIAYLRVSTFWPACPDPDLGQFT